MVGFTRVAVLAVALWACGSDVSGQPGDDPFVDEVISYAPGMNSSPSYNDPLTALGSPERMSGKYFGISDVVSAFSPPYAPDEIVSIGNGGFLVVKFNTPVTDDPNNLYGIDLLIFGNTGFIDADWPNGIAAGVFGDDGGTVEVSSDGVRWIAVPAASADGIFPTMGYRDSGPYDHSPGALPTDFTQPVDPKLTVKDFDGMNNVGIVQRYLGSGGGFGIDIGSAGIDAVQYVRISNSVFASDAIEVDAFSDVAPRLPGDVDLNGVIDVDDLIGLLSAWGATIPGGPPADFDISGVIDVDDLLILLNHWSS